MKFKLYHLAFLKVFILMLSILANAQVEVLRIDKEIRKPADTTIEVISKNITDDSNINPDDLIHYGDLIDIDVLGSTEYDWRGTITPEGYLNGIDFTENEVYGLCRTGKQVAADIADSYKKFLNEPLIDVTILDRSKRPVSTLLGAVNLPQRFKLKRKVLLNELIILAGGFTEKASGEIQILRRADTSCAAMLEANANRESNNGQKKKEIVKVKQDNGPKFINIKISDLLSGKKESNPQIYYGDIITVLIADPIYVIGGVVNPSKLSVREKMTVSRAITSAGGLTEKADSKNIAIFRRSSGKTSVIKINLDEIQQQNAEDLVLKAYDIVDVSEKGRNINKFAPVINFDFFEKRSKFELPLRIID